MTLRLESEGTVARLLIDRAAKRNAFDQAMWAALPGLVAEAVASPAARVMVLQAADEGAFCAGADIAELMANKDDAAWRAANHAAIGKAQSMLARAAKPTIAFIDGDCVGGGCGLAMACDIRVATPRARFGITPAKLGLVYPLHDTKLLVDLVGPGQAIAVHRRADRRRRGTGDRAGRTDRAAGLARRPALWRAAQRDEARGGGRTA